MAEAIGRRLGSLAKELRLLRSFDELQHQEVGMIFADARAARARRRAEIIVELEELYRLCLEWRRSARAEARAGASWGVLASAELLRGVERAGGGRGVPAG